MDDMEKYSLIKTNNINEAEKEIDKASKENKKIIVYSQNDQFNRKILENKKVNVLVAQLNKKGKLKQRESDLNQVLCKLAFQNDIELAIDLNILKNKTDKEISENISKIIELIKLCKKYKNKIIIINSNKNKHDLLSFLLSLRMPTNMAKYAVENSINL